MNGEIDNIDDDDDIESSAEDDESDDDGEDVSISDEEVELTDNVGDLSVEINVEDIIRRIEANAGADLQRKREIRRRLDEIREARESAAEMDNTFNLYLDDDS